MSVFVYFCVFVYCMCGVVAIFIHRNTCHNSYYKADFIWKLYTSCIVSALKQNTKMRGIDIEKFCIDKIKLNEAWFSPHYTIYNASLYNIIDLKHRFISRYIPLSSEHFLYHTHSHPATEFCMKIDKMSEKNNNLH